MDTIFSGYLASRGFVRYERIKGAEKMKFLEFRRASRYALKRLEGESLPEFTYHTAKHTKNETTAYTRRLARREG